MTPDQKVAVVEELKALLTSAKATILLSQKGMTVDMTTQFRRNLRKEGAGFRVIKNTLMHRAIEGTPLAFFQKDLAGPLAIAYTDKDPAALAKVLVAFLKGNQKVAMVGGALGARALTEADLKALAQLPSIEVLRGMLLGALTGVPRTFLGLLQAPGRDMVGVLAARERQLSGAA